MSATPSTIATTPTPSTTRNVHHMPATAVKTIATGSPTSSDSTPITSMTRLAREAALSSGGFTKIADRLATAGLIRREPCTTDRRVTYAVLTDHGRDMAEQSKKTCAEILRHHVLTPLGSEQSAALAAAMRTLRTANSAESPE